MRFAFQRGGPLGFWREQDDAAYQVPALPLSGLLRDPRVMIFLIVWFGINLLFGMVSLPIGGNDQPVAWLFQSCLIEAEVKEAVRTCDRPTRAPAAR